MTDQEVEFRDITTENLAQHPSGAVGVAILTALFAGLFVWAWRRDTSLSRQTPKRNDMVCMTSTIFGPRHVSEDNSQYKVITDSGRTGLQKILHIWKLRIKHKHRWVSIFTRRENTRYQTRERVLVLYVYMLSVFMFGAIFHGQKASVAGFVFVGIFSSLLALLPTLCVAQLFKNSRSAESSKNMERKKSLRDYDADSVDSNAQDEYAANRWNLSDSQRNPTKCGLFFATLCGGHLNSEDTLEYERLRGDGTESLAFSPTVNLFTYFVALAWTMECVVLVVAFSVQFDLIPTANMPEASAWGLSILFAALWDFLISQPSILFVSSAVTVFTTKMYKHDPTESQKERKKSTQRKKLSRKESRTSKRKELSLDIGSTRVRKDQKFEREIKTEPVTVGRTQGGGVREMSSTPGTLNFLVDGEADTKRLKDSRVYGQAEVQQKLPSPRSTEMHHTCAEVSMYSTDIPPTSPEVSPSQSSAQVFSASFETSETYDNSAFPETPISQQNEGYGAPSYASTANAGIGTPSNKSTVAPLPSDVDASHSSNASRAPNLRSPSFIAALSLHKVKRNSMQPPVVPWGISALRSELASPSSDDGSNPRSSEEPTDAEP